MLREFRGFVVAAAMCAAAPALAENLPVSAYGALPVTEDVAISPDGERIAILANTSDGKRGLVITDIDTGASKGGAVPNIKTRAVEWASNDYVVLFATETTHIRGARRFGKLEFSGALSINADTLATKLLLADDPDIGANVSLAGIVGSERGGDVVYMPAWTEPHDLTGGRTGDDGRQSLFRVDLESGDGRMVYRGEETPSDYIMDQDANLVARGETDQRRRRERVYAIKDNGGERLIYDKSVDYPELGLIGLDAAGDNLIVSLRRDEDDKSKIFKMSLADGSLSAPLFEHPDVDVGARRDPYTRALIGFVYATEEQHVVWIDPELKALQASLDEAFAGQMVVLASWSRDRRRFIVYAEGDANPGAYFFFDRDTGRAEQVGELYPDVPPDMIGEVRAITYAARDGLEIPAYLTLPPGKPARDLPLVAMPHGGPEARDIKGFDWMAQFLAARGYAVLQPQFRGSDGYGRAFRDAGRGRWGKEMQWDVSDGVLHLIDEGIADPDRVCIFGWSYGGYSALAGAAFTPELYKCVVAGAPVSDVPDMMRWEEVRTGRDSWVTRYWDMVIGEDPSFLREISPARHVANVRAPILLIHGDDDTVVPFEQSEIMERAMRQAGREVKFVELENEDHWMSRGPTRTQALAELGAFIDANLKP